MSLPEDLESALDQLSVIIEPIVRAIESHMPVTRNHYEEYMAAITKIGKDLCKDDKRLPSICLGVGFAMIQAGASKDGVRSALKALGHMP